MTFDFDCIWFSFYWLFAFAYISTVLLTLGIDCPISLTCERVSLRSSLLNPPCIIISFSALITLKKLSIPMMGLLNMSFMTMCSSLRIMGWRQSFVPITFIIVITCMRTCVPVSWWARPMDETQASWTIHAFIVILPSAICRIVKVDFWKARMRWDYHSTAWWIPRFMWVRIVSILPLVKPKCAVWIRVYGSAFSAVIRIRNGWVRGRVMKMLLREASRLLSVWALDLLPWSRRYIIGWSLSRLLFFCYFCLPLTLRMDN